VPGSAAQFDEVSRINDVRPALAPVPRTSNAVVFTVGSCPMIRACWPLVAKLNCQVAGAPWVKIETLVAAMGKLAKCAHAGRAVSNKNTDRSAVEWTEMCAFFISQKSIGL